MNIESPTPNNDFKAVITIGELPFYFKECE